MCPISPAPPCAPRLTDALVDDPAADAEADRDHHVRRVLAPVAVHDLRGRECVDVVVDQDRHAERVAQSPADRGPAPAERRCVDHAGRLRVDRARQPDADAEQVPVVRADDVLEDAAERFERVSAAPGRTGSDRDARTVPSRSTETTATWSAVTLAPIAPPAARTSPSSVAGRPPLLGTDRSSVIEPACSSSLVVWVTVAGLIPSARAMSARDDAPRVPSRPSTAARTRSPRGETCPDRAMRPPFVWT